VTRSLLKYSDETRSERNAIDTLTNIHVIDLILRGVSIWRRPISWRVKWSISNLKINHGHADRIRWQWRITILKIKRILKGPFACKMRSSSCLQYWSVFGPFFYSGWSRPLMRRRLGSMPDLGDLEDHRSILHRSWSQNHGTKLTGPWLHPPQQSFAKVTRSDESNWLRPHRPESNDGYIGSARRVPPLLGNWRGPQIGKNLCTLRNPPSRNQFRKFMDSNL